MTQVNVLDAKNRLSQLIKAAAAGEDIVIANRGVPVARLVAITPEEDQSTGKSLVSWLDSHPLPTHASRSSEDIEAGIAEERASWE